MKLFSGFVVLWSFFLAAFAQADGGLLEPAFYSSEGRERVVVFEGSYLSEMKSLEEVGSLSQAARENFGLNHIKPTLKFLFGPLTHRALASPQRGSDVQVKWEAASLERGRVLLPYSYKGVWIVDKDVPESFELPVPLNADDLLTARWKSCTDSDPEHQTQWFYWYFWDPERSGCDHKLGREYAQVKVKLETETPNLPASYPEYDKLLESTGEANRLQLTFAFGYVQDPANPNPETDWDSGVMEYRKFLGMARSLLGSSFRETKILQKEYRGSRTPTKVIGRRFSGQLRGAEVTVNVVAAAGIDQMELFAKSFAHDHDAFFGWFGHSRVGSGFDAESFWRMVLASPDYYSVSSRYQLIYWGGCNSYSYYTLPFFEFKAHAANGADPSGTKGLDIIANGLPSYFSLNADNASIALANLLRWDQRPSYQTIVNDIEAKAKESGIDVLVAVLGDEDNP